MAYSCAIEKYSLSIFIAKITQSHIIFSDFDNNEKDEQFMITFIIETFFCVINFIAYKWTCQIFTMICGVSSSRRQEIFKRRQKNSSNALTRKRRKTSKRSCSSSCNVYTNLEIASRCWFLLPCLPVWPQRESSLIWTYRFNTILISEDRLCINV